MTITQTQNILILAHPGHELRIHRWLELNRPRVYLLTDGSGAREQSRTHFSRSIVEETGSTCGSVFGEIPDKTWYAALADRDLQFFRSILKRIEDDLTDGQSFRLIADAVDGYNPIHDLASAMGVALQKRLIAGRRKATLEFSAAIPSASGHLVAELFLDEAARARKRKAIEGYAPLAEAAANLGARFSSNRPRIPHQTKYRLVETSHPKVGSNRQRACAGRYVYIMPDVTRTLSAGCSRSPRDLSI